MRPLLILVIAALSLSPRFPSAAAQAPSGPAGRHVVLVTIDGMRGDYLGSADAYHLNVPTLRRLMHDGAVSPRTVSVFPTLTGTAHTALVTGTGAMKHGILGNNKFAPEVWAWEQGSGDNYSAQPSYRDYKDIKVGTLWSAAHAKGLKTASIGWPQTAGGPIDYRLDVIVAPTAPESHARTQRAASPGWLDQVEQKVGPVGATDIRMADHFKALVGAEIIRTFKPALLAIHFSATDAAQHANGPGTPPAIAALEQTDANLADVLAAIDTAGLAPSTTVIVTGDHGFLPMHTELAINLPLVEAGLITRGADGHPAWTAIIAPNRGLGSLYVKDKSPATIAKARETLEKYRQMYPRRFRIVERAELDEWSADRDAVLGIEPVVGYVLDARLTAPFARPHPRAAGHGYRPDTPGMETGFIAYGPGVRHTVLPTTNTIDIAPTIATILGLELPDADGKPIVGIFRPAHSGESDQP